MEFERKVNKINDHLYSVEEGVVRWFVVTGEEKAAVIDTGYAGSGALSLARTLTDKELILINTHGDVDHVSGNGDFDACCISESDYNDFNLKEKFPDTKPEFLSDGMKIELGNRTLEIITAEGHTKGSIAVLDRQGRSLFAGDTVSDDKIFLFGLGRVPEAFGDSLKKIISRKSDFDSIFAAHGTCELPVDFAEKNLSDWNKILNKEIKPEDTVVWGETVKSCKGDSCIFLIK